jgi:hypothetical protein
MQTVWLKDVKDRESFEKRVRSSKEVLDKLKEICYNKQLEITRVRLKDYTAPNYIAERAHRDGYSDCLDYIISLLTLDPREKE